MTPVFIAISQTLQDTSAAFIGATDAGRCGSFGAFLPRNTNSRRRQRAR